MAKNISLSGATASSGWFTVNGGGNFRTEDLETGMVAAAQVDGKTITLTSHATVGVVNDSNDKWTIDLTKATGDGRQASIKGHDKGGDVVYGSSGDDSISIAGGANVELYLYGGNDSVVAEEKTDKAYVEAGDGDDLITIGGASVTVSAGAGADQVSLSGASVNAYGEAGNDSIAIFGDYAYVDGGEGNDSISVGGTNATVIGGKGNDSIQVTGNNANVDGGDGNDTVSVGGANSSVYGGAGNDSILAAGANAYIEAGDGNDIISIGASDAVVNAGAGADSVVIAAGKKASITLGEGKDTISVGGATGVSLEDYTYGTDVIVLGGSAGSNNAKIGDVTLSTDGVISVTDTSVQINAADGYYKAALSASTDGTTSQRYAWASSTGSTIDLSSEVSPFYVRADLNDAEADSVVGGRGDDSIIVASNDFVNGGRGNDEISVASNATGVTVALSAGSDTVKNASGLLGFGDDAIALYVEDDTNLKFVLSSGLTASIKSDNVKFDSVKGEVANVKVNVAGTTKNYQLIAAGNAAAVDDEATVVYGLGQSSVSVASGESSTVIDLSNHNHFGDTQTYTNINYINASASDGDDILIGGESATTIQAGKGNSSIFGIGAKADSLVGGEGKDTFFYGAGYGNDSIANYSNGDEIVFFQGQTGFTKDKNALKLSIGDEALTIRNTDNDKENMIYTLSTYGDAAFTMKIGVEGAKNNFTYAIDEDTTQWYFGNGSTDTLTLTGSKNGEIWLGETWNGVTYTGIEKLDASSATGDYLIWGGTDDNSTILAGSGQDTLFGGFGASGNDVLTGHEGQANTFEFGLGCGNDTITSSKSEDSVFLYNAASTDVKSVAVAGRNLVLTFSDDSTLSISTFNASSSVNTFKFSDGTKKYDTTSKSLVAAE